uniref:Uncharacterized protein n=1 Tax=Anguilla anguilla TaxID=7936 RepID=A0A0E9QMU0_ANGAN
MSSAQNFNCVGTAVVTFFFCAIHPTKDKTSSIMCFLYRFFSVSKNVPTYFLPIVVPELQAYNLSSNPFLIQD